MKKWHRMEDGFYSVTALTTVLNLTMQYVCLPQMTSTLRQS
jgi:hypothetical protein